MSSQGTKTSSSLGGAGGAYKSSPPSSPGTLLPNTPDMGLKILRMRLATITARLQTLISIIKRKNTDLATLMSQLHFLKSRAKDIKREIKPADLKKAKHLIEFQEISMDVASDLLRQAME